MYVLIFLLYKSSYVLKSVCLLDVSEKFVSRVSSMYNVIMHYLNSFLSCSIRNLTLAPLSCLFTMKSDVFPPFTSFNSHSGLFP